MNTLVREVCGAAAAPREWRRSLGKQRLVLRSGVVRSSLGGVGARFRGALVGEELIGTLSERLARSLQGLDAGPTEVVAANTAVRRADEVVGELPPARRLEPSERGAATVGARPESAAQIGVGERTWDNGAVANGPRPMGNATRVVSPTLRAAVDGVIAERGAEIVRALGLDVASARQKRDTVRTSPLDSALRRYWQTPTRSTTETASHVSGPVASRSESGVAPLPDATGNRSRPRAAGVEPIATRADLELPDPAAPSESRGWWSTRIDAIHSRTESFTPAPARPSAARFDDDVVDESAFADALADVLHRQARAYGVVVP